MTNSNTSAAWKYHNTTKHSYASIRTNPHVLDWNNKPLEYKIYPTLEVTRLPREATQTGVSALSAVAATSIPVHDPALPTLENLAQILFLSAGITKSRKYPGGEIFFRAAACTGALYEVELYLVCGDLPELAAGIYHFGVAEFGLRQLRAGDYRSTLVEATGTCPSVAHAPLTIICTGTFWRNAWKYEARTYRHFGWDNGTIIANMLAATAALGLPAKVVLGFADAQVNQLLSLDTHREVALTLIPVGFASTALAASPEITPLDLPLIPLSKTEIDYPAMRDMHEASSLASGADAEAWRNTSLELEPASQAGKLIELPRAEKDQLSSDTLDQVILRRGSTRKFAPVPITSFELSTLLYHATRGIPADYLHPVGARLNGLYLIVNDVEGIASGSYFYHRKQHALDLLRHGRFRKMAGYLALEQQLAADASVCIFFLADLARILDRFGNRGYRATQLEAGILGGKLYLAAYAQGLGATGLTFYDDDVAHFFSPHAQGKNAMFLIAVGRSALPR